MSQRLDDDVRHGRRPHRGALDARELGFDPEKDVELFGDRVLIAREVPVGTTEGGIHIPEQSQELRHSGWILQKGPSCINDSIKVGHRVLLTKWSGGIEMELNGREVIICLEQDIVCKISDDFAAKAKRLD